AAIRRGSAPRAELSCSQPGFRGALGPGIRDSSRLRRDLIRYKPGVRSIHPVCKIEAVPHHPLITRFARRSARITQQPDQLFPFISIHIERDAEALLFIGHSYPPALKNR